LRRHLPHLGGFAGVVGEGARRPAERLPDCWHFAMEDKPEEIAALVVDFLWAHPG